MSEWPVNTNPVLTVFREGMDSGDKWGSTINFLFGLCDVAMSYDVAIPAELEFAQSPFGADEDNDYYKAIEGLLTENVYIHQPLDLPVFQKHVEHALKVLARYDSLLRLNGESY